MRAFYQVCGMIVLALWLPASSCCLLERTSLIEEQNCCTSEKSGRPAPHPESPAPCCLLVSGHYTVEVKSPNAGTHRTVFQASAIALSEPGGTKPELHEPDRPGTAPPDIAVGWHLLQRAAIPPRAPTASA